MCIKYNVENPDLAVGDAMHAHSKVKCHLDLSVPQLVNSNTFFPNTFIRILSNLIEHINIITNRYNPPQ